MSMSISKTALANGTKSAQTPISHNLKFLTAQPQPCVLNGSHSILGLRVEQLSQLLGKHLGQLFYSERRKQLGQLFYTELGKQLGQLF